MVTRAADLRADPRPVDKDVKVPRAVQEAAERAEAAQRAAYPDQNPAPAPEPAPPSNPDTIVIADPPAAPAPQPAPVTPPGNPPPAPQPAPQPVPQQWAPEVELEMQRIRSAEGRRRAQLEAQILAANDRTALLENAVEELRAQLTAPAPAAPTPAQRLITPEEETNFGPEMLDVMGRRATEAVSPLLAELRGMMHTIDQKVTSTVAATKTSAKQMMLNTLDRDLPEWRQINTTDGFKAWLSFTDPLLGVNRQGALLKAYEQHDTARVLKFFQSFVSELAASTPESDPPAEPSPARAPARPSLEALAAPGRARMSAQPNAPAEKQIITTADVNAFYTAVRQGHYRGREAEKEALEQELFAAQREGRVRPA